MKRIFLIDGNSLANRAFYAMPFLTNNNGEPSGAVFGFANLIIKLITEEKPDELIVAFDHARKTFRNGIYADYKANRKPMPEELRSQIPVIKEMLKIMNITTIESDGIEADDILGALSKQFDDCKKFIVSGDRDLLQLITDTTEVWLTKKGVTDILAVNLDNLQEAYGVKYPYQVIELKSLMGDASDNIPGVMGVGEKTALKLIEDYDNLQNLYDNIDKITGKLKEKLESDKDNAFMSRTLATINTESEFEYEKRDMKFPFSFDVFTFFKEWNFTSIIKRNNLFEAVKSDDNVVAKMIKIENGDVVKELIFKIKNKFSYNFEKMQFSPNRDEIYFIEPNPTMFDIGLSLDEFLTLLKDVFENEKILKITTNAKKDKHVLNGLNINLVNFFDLSIANYLLETGKGGKIDEDLKVNNYADEEVVYTEKLAKNEVFSLYKSCEIPLVDVLYNMEKSGFKIDEGKLAELDKFYSEELENYTREIIDLAGEEFNINSPKQVSDILFNKLQLKSYNNKKQSTSADILEDMIFEHPIVEKILNYRKLNKLKSTYIDVYKKICAEKGNIIHTVFNQTLTNTGRLSSSDPNLQNIPTRDELGKNLRKLFISRFENGKIISADYNQIELRLLAAMSGEPELIKAYNRGDDIHAMTASQIFNIDINDVTPAQRRDAKAVNFGIIYGISEYGLSQNIKTSIKRAKEYIEAYFEKYPLVKEFMNQNVDFAKANGYVKTYFGRKRYIPEINASNYNVRTFAERVAMNMPLQGTASDIIKFAMIDVFNKLKELNSKLILQIHDELIIDVYPGEEEQVKKILQNSMEKVVDFAVKLPVSISIGKNLFEC